MEKCFAVIDTNIVVSALYKKGGNPDKIIGFVFDGNIVPVLHDKILAEYNEVCSRSKFPFDKKDVKNIIEGIVACGIVCSPEKSGEMFKHESDRIFYEVALAAKGKFGEAYLVTGNGKHFPTKPFVLPPAQMVAIIEESKK